MNDTLNELKSETMGHAACSSHGASPVSASVRLGSPIEQLMLDPHGFGFFQAVRLLDRWLGEGRAPGVGLQRLEFRNSMSLSFPASEIESIRVSWRDPGGARLPANSPAHSPVHAPSNVDKVEMTPACMGLLGVTGALPLFYTEWLGQVEQRSRDPSARAFLDVFSHRSVLLFYQAWRKHRLALQYEADRQMAFLPHVLALAGLGLKGLRERLEPLRGGVSDEGLAYFSGALQQRKLPAAQLQRLLQRYLGVPVDVEPFVGRWYRIPQEGRTRLGLCAADGLALGQGSGVLGRSAVVGERVWQRNLRMRLVLGPLDLSRFRRFLPGGPGERALRHWLGLLLGTSLEFEVRLRLRKDDVRPLALIKDRDESVGRLGWDTFLLTRSASADRDDVRYDIQAAA